MMQTVLFSSYALFWLIVAPTRVAGFVPQTESLGSTTVIHAATKSTPFPEKTKLLILPGFGNDSVDYTMENSIVDSLVERGWDQETQIRVLPVARSDWLQVFWKGAFDLQFWASTADPTRPAFRWYLDRIAKEIDELQENEKIILLGHSAGGWLARAAVGYGALAASTATELDTEEFINASPIALDKVLGLVTLGTPNLPPPQGFMDMTRGALRITNERFPGSYHAPSMFYITALGLSVKGEVQQRKSPLEPTTVTGFAFNSYEAVCGDGTTIGDGVVPRCAGHLEDAIQLDLEGVYHSINRLDAWYGASGVLDRWHDLMIKEVDKKSASTVSREQSIFDLFGFFQAQ